MAIELERNKEDFKALLTSTKRPGMENLLEFVESTDFYKAPASTRFHMAVEGGLCQHSLNVYNCLMAKKQNPVWAKALEGIGEDSIAIVALLHDLCKADLYEKDYRNEKTYDEKIVAAAEKWQVKKDEKGSFIWHTVPSYKISDNRVPLGHGEKSALLVQGFIQLSLNEVMAIRWHMGFTEPKDIWNDLGYAMEKHPLVLALHEADLEATKLLETD